MTKDHSAALKEFRKLIYEPEHTSTVCWCDPLFFKQRSGRLKIVHRRQKDDLVNFVKLHFLL